jgi:methyl-accepting chemotaxis protein
MQINSPIFAPVKKLMSRLSLTKKFTLIVMVVLLGYLPPSIYVYCNMSHTIGDNKSEILGMQYLQLFDKAYIDIVQSFASFKDRSNFISSAQKSLEALHAMTQQKSVIPVNSNVEQLLNTLSSLTNSNDEATFQDNVSEVLAHMMLTRAKIASTSQLSVDPELTYYLINANTIQFPSMLNNYVRFSYFNNLAYAPAASSIQPATATPTQSKVSTAQIEYNISAGKISDFDKRVQDDFDNVSSMGSDVKDYVNKVNNNLTTMNDSIKKSLNAHQNESEASTNINNLISALSDGKTLILQLLVKRSTQYVGLFWIIIASIICSIILVLYCITGFMEAIRNPMADLMASIKLIASGNLVSEIHAHGTDEFNDVLLELSEMQHDLLSVIQQINEVSSTLNLSAQEIATSNGDLSERTQEQASCLVETSSSLNSLTDTIKKNAESARDAADQSNNATQVAQRGGEAVNQVITTMTDINNSAQKIQEITGVIDGIAFQTNLLALNASVEAARAGEQGRGFAVVASEVRNLAQRSAEAAKQIKGLINDSMSKVASGDAQVKVTYETMKEVVASIESVNTIIGQIAVASNEQSNSIEEINIVISQLEGNTQKNAAQVEEVAASAELLKDQSSKLVGIVTNFEIDKAAGHSTKSHSEYNKKPTEPKKSDSSRRPDVSKKMETVKKSDTSKKFDAPKKQDFVKKSDVVKKYEPVKAEIKSPSHKETSVLEDDNAWKEF